jgi:hypothetical protein
MNEFAHPSGNLPYRGAARCDRCGVASSAPMWMASPASVPGEPGPTMIDRAAAALVSTLAAS